MKRVFSGVLLTALLAGMLCLVFNVLPVIAQGTIYIRADGTIDPPTISITTIDNVTYTFMDNVDASIVVERDNIVIDGAGYTVQGIGSTGACGFCLSGINNVTIKNTKITGFDFSVFLNSTSDNVLSGNDITPGEFTGAVVKFNNASNNLLSGNNGSFSVSLDHSSYNSIVENGKVHVSLVYSSNNSILENEMEGGAWGISLYYSSNNTIIGNNITHGGYGIRILYSSNNNSILGNNITRSHSIGVWLQSSSNNILGNNSIAGSLDGNFGVEGEVLEHFSNDIDATNTVDGRPVYYWISERDRTVPLDAGYVALVNCTNITAKELNLTNNLECILLACTTNSTVTRNHITDAGVGIRLCYSSDNSFSENDITSSGGGIEVCDSSNNSLYKNNIGASSGYGVWVNSSSNIRISENNITGSSSDGIYLEDSSNNTIAENNITANNQGIAFLYSNNNALAGNNITDSLCGISISGFSNNNTLVGNNIANNSQAMYIDTGSSNLVYHNNFINNSVQVELYFAANIWDNGCEGNYWSDYNGADSNGDGIGDTPYVIDADNQDNYPLVSPYEYWSNPIPADVNRDMRVDIRDIAYVCLRFLTTPASPNWNSICDMNSDGVVNMSDIAITCGNFGKHYS
jgi:parallel beta-helix repeat protein